MVIVLLVTLLLAGSDKPIQNMEKQVSMEACETAAHKYNVAKVPDEAVLSSAACLRIREAPPGNPT